MLIVSSDISKYSKFKEHFKDGHEIIDLSRVPSSELVNECESITEHHAKAVVFLGYLEPGWMLESTHQTRIRKLFRKFEVGFVCAFPESIPHSWKTEIFLFYPETLNQNGNPNSLNDGSAVQDKSNV